jgi:hypothetical protein
MPKKTEEALKKKTEAVITKVTKDIDDEVDEVDPLDTSQKMRMFKTQIAEFVRSSTYKLDVVPHAIATWITKLSYREKTDSAEAQAAKGIVEGQVVRFFKMMIGLWILLNWWYILNFTNLYFDIQSWVRWMPDAIRPLFEASLSFPSFLNDMLFNRRMDANMHPSIHSFFCKLWEWRPILFALLSVFFINIVANGSILNVFLGPLAGDMGWVSGLCILFALGSYAKAVALNADVVMKLANSIPFPGWPILLLLGLIVVLAIGALMAPLVGFYLFFFSFLSLPLFSGVNLFANIRAIFDNLRAAPVSNTNPASIMGKLGNFFFQNFSTLYFAILVLTFLFANIVEVAQGISKRQMLISLLLINLFLLGVYTSNILIPAFSPIMNEIIAYLYKKPPEEVYAPEEGGSSTLDTADASIPTAAAAAVVTTPIPVATTTSAAAASIPAVSIPTSTENNPSVQ